MMKTSYQNAAIDYTKKYLERLLKMESMVVKYLEKKQAMMTGDAYQ